jgi:hypothetical protein
LNIITLKEGKYVCSTYTKVDLFAYAAAQTKKNTSLFIDYRHISTANIID